MIGRFSLPLLMLAFALATLASYVALKLAQRMRVASPWQSKPWFIGGGIALGTGWWASQFASLMALHPPWPYDPLLAIASFAVAVVVSSAGLRVNAIVDARIRTTLPAGILIGIGILAVQLLGIAAMRPGIAFEYHPGLIAFDLVIAVVAAWRSICLVRSLDPHSTSKRVAAALAIAASITLLQQTGIAGTGIGSFPILESNDERSHWLTMVIATIATLIGGFTLIAVALDRRARIAVERSRQTLIAANIELEQNVVERTEKLTNEEARSRAIMASALDCIISTDSDGFVTDFNYAAEMTFGYHRHEALGRFVGELVLPARQQAEFTAILHRSKSTPQLTFGERLETTMQRSDGTQFPAEYAISQIVLGDDRFYNMFLRDITARRASEQALKAAKEAAEAASDAKTTFLATMSHEIRTPMNALLGIQELLSLTRLDDEQRESMRLMRQSSKSLLRLIDDILDFSKIEAGKMEIGSELTALRDLVADVCATFLPIAREKGLTLTYETSADLPPLAMTDPLRLRQVLSNLLSNAIKFTSTGGVRVWATKTPDPEHACVVDFQIEDTGIGMSGDVIRSCGEPFRQADAGMARRYGGSGLGLAICRRLCRLMRGTLDISSELGVGTRILVRLPVIAVAETRDQFRPDVTQGLILSMPSKAPDIEQAAQDNRLILVVDDHPTNRRLLVQQLEWLGYACEAYADGRSALARYVERLASGHPYAMTITDCQMPEMDGYELARAIRSSETGTPHKTVLVAFTANTMRTVSELCESCGFNELMTKPVNLATLKARLDRWLPLAQAQALLTPSAPMTVSAAQDPEMQDEFRVAHEEDLAMMAQGQKAGDAALVARAAHRIIGAARMIGARRLDEAAAGVLRAARTEDWRQVREAIDAVHQATLNLYADFDRTRNRQDNRQDNRLNAHPAMSKAS